MKRLPFKTSNQPVLDKKSSTQRRLPSKSRTWTSKRRKGLRPRPMTSPPPKRPAPRQQTPSWRTRTQRATHKQTQWSPRPNPPQRHPSNTMPMRDQGWGNFPSKDGATAGTEGKARAIEALKVSLANADGGIRHSAHCVNVGWQGLGFRRSHCGHNRMELPDRSD